MRIEEIIMQKIFTNNDLLFHKMLGEVIVREISEEYIKVETMSGQEYLFQEHDFGKVLFISKESEKTAKTQGMKYLTSNHDELISLRKANSDKIKKMKLERENKVLAEIEKHLEVYDFESAKENYEKNKGFITAKQFKDLNNEYLEKEEILKKETSLNDVEYSLRNYEFATAEKEYEKLKKYIEESTYLELKEFYLKALKSNKGKDIQKKLEVYDYEAADNLFDKYKDYFDLKEYEKLKKSYILKEKEGKVDQELDIIKVLLKEYKFDEAEEEFSKTKIIDKKVYVALKDKYTEILEIDTKINELLDSYEFSEADDLYYSAKLGDYFPQEEYEDKKAFRIRRYFEENFYDGEDSFLLDLEQAAAINTKNTDILVAARAGSGKTRVIVALILYLLEIEKIPKDSIMVLAFNRNVPEEIRNRIHNKVVLKSAPSKYNSIDIVLTFHKFALEISNTKEKILADNRKIFIRNLIEYMIENDKKFASRVYDFFRKESLEYEDLRNKKNVTLKGEVVKSNGEKWIADFLFEHGIEYFYEYSFYPSYINKDNIEGTETFKKRFLNFIKENNSEIKPSFYLRDSKIVWEHWEIDDTETNKEVQNDFLRTFGAIWQEYKEKLTWRRDFWKSWKVDQLITNDHWAIKSIKNVNELIETSIKDSAKTREEFEETIMALLKEQGINPKKRSREKLVKEVSERSLNRFTNLVTSFIDRYQQNFFDSRKNFKELIESFKSNARTYEFLNLSTEIFDLYEKELASTNKIPELAEFNQYNLDFNQLLCRAIDRIDSGEVDKEIKKLKYLLIDEYQDFSELFFRLIEAIRKRNPEINLFCVGDDWQAINRFAGSNTAYFTEFDSYFPDSLRKEIGTNYRSVEEIIKRSNNFMKKNGFPGIEAKSANSTEEPSVIKELMTFVPLNEARVDDQEFINEFIDKNGERAKDITMKSKYLKKCYEIIKGNPEKGFLILHRYNNFRYDVNLKSFREKLCRILINNKIIEDEETIKISTMHSSKGMEEDIVILLEANENILESVHPDNELFEIFGDNLETALEDQKRLFYVAITRAREKVYLLYEKDKESNYINDLFM